ncbi:aspartate--tRNA ligase [Patescibacteria group bacterium]|nr:aspartate--tRNA ligase [Patescibacteria group bacterium]MBU1890948.1 aspartate--tRNA ligase [Patescibacteria group bacterium]
MSRVFTSQANKLIGKSAVFSGWAQTVRRMGKLVFINLRDKDGLLQITCSPDIEKTYETARKVRPEFVIQVKGKIVERDQKNINPDMATGKVEVSVEKLTIISESETPPFEIVNEERQASEEIRLQYRYLDLRHERMKQNLVVRHQAIHFIRNYLNNEGFIEIQTPILSKSTPEGARDYLVPSRIHKGKFFALPQSPQQYKQLLMVAGFERYFQIAPCFRDEAARADRSPGEFYQIDIEMAFVEQEDILKLSENLFSAMIKEVFPNKKIPQTPWPRLTHAEVMKKYGTDKPDLRKDKKDKDELAFAWIIDFPLFTKQSQEDYFHGSGNKLAPSHHMFTAPKKEDIPLLESSPEQVRAYQHDLVLNGFEVGGGSIRIHQPEIQNKVFDIIGFSKDQKKQFRHLMTAFKYGVPPHGGIAPGVERILMAIMGEKSVKEIMAFPMTGEARDPMMGAPSKVAPAQLRELGIKIDKEDK